MRRIDLEEGDIKALRAWKLLQTEQRLSAREWLNPQLVFTAQDGSPRDRTLAQRSLGRALKAAGLPQISLHNLRHTAATIMFGLGFPPKLIAERLGHADASVTMRTYAHTYPTQQRDLARAMNNALYRKRVG
jgi:integrase